jgi:hypothetical protein
MWFTIGGGLLGLLGMWVRGYDERARPRIVRGNMLLDQITRKMHSASKVVAETEQFLIAKGADLVAGNNPDDVLTISDASQLKFNVEHELRVRQWKLIGFAIASCGVLMPLIGAMLHG